MTAAILPPATSPSRTTHAGAFRRDIEGLRALAILPILANHAGVRGFAGGFVGVDIFFVISGYLITRIIVRDVAEGRHSIAEFYRRRILRIFPALFVLLPVVGLVGLAALSPSELVALARSAIATTFFVSNFHFLGDTGYFAPAAATRPLLHTWSLAIEEQFYIFWPLLLAVAIPRDRAARWGAVWVVVVASFAAAVWMTHVDMAVAFYQIPFRAWELGLGGVLTSLPFARLPRWSRELLSGAGLLAIAYSTHRYEEQLVFPGLGAAMPCLGAAAIIAAGPEPVVNRLLSLSPARFFGRISYSLYLWHWPVIVFASLWFFLPRTAAVIAGEIALSVLLGWLSWRFVEQRGRDLLATLPRPRLFVVALAGMLAMGAGFGALVAADGVPGRFTPRQRALDAQLGRNDQQAYRQGSCFVVGTFDRFDAARCLDEVPGKPTVLLMGDSLAAHYWPGIAAADLPFHVAQATMIGCKPVFYPANEARACAGFFEGVLRDWIPRHRPQAVVLAGRWQQEDVALLDRTLRYLHSIGQRAVVMGSMPIYDAPLPRLLFFAPPGDPTARARAGLVRAASSGMNDAMRAVAQRRGVPFVSPYDALCTPAGCQAFAAPGIPLQFDDAHLTVEGSRMLVRRLAPALERAVGVAPPRPVAAGAK